MARHIDFRDDLHMTGRGVANDVAHFVLGVIAAIARAVGFDAPRTQGGEARIFADLEPPPLIVGQVPMQHVELVPRHPVDHGAYERRRLKVPRGIEHQAAPSIAWRISDSLDWNL